MEENTQQWPVYESVPLAVFPQVVPRAAIVALVYAGGALFFISATEGRAVDDLSNLAVALGGLVFAVVFVAILAIAYVGYRNRRYELTPEGIVETTGVFSTTETTFPYEDVEDMTFTQSRLQSMYGVATIRINHIDTDQVGDEEELRIRHVETPENIYSEIRSAIVDSSGGSSTAVPPLDFESVSSAADLSSLSADWLAIETSSSHLMPIAIVHPWVLTAAGAGFLASLPVGMFPAVFVYDIGGLTPLPWGYETALVMLGFGLLGALWYAWRYDRTQYELYRDHVRKIRGANLTSVQFDEVADVEFRGVSLGFATVGTITLRNEKEDTLVKLKHVREPAELAQTVAQLADIER